MHKNRVWLRFMSLWITCIFLLCSCAAQNVDNSAEPQAESESRTADSTEDISEPDSSPADSDIQKEEPLPLEPVLRFTMVLQENYNPLKVTDPYAAQVLSLLYAPLIDFDDEGNAHPSIASEWEMAEDNRSVTLTVNPDAKWEDGEQVSSADIAYSIVQIRENENSPYQACIQRIADTSILSDDKITILFTTASPFNLNQLYFPIICRDYFYADDHETEPYASGPYMVESYETMEKWHLTANPEYFGKTPGIPNAEIILTRSEARMTSFDQGVTNVVYQADLAWSGYMNEGTVTLHTFSSSELMMLSFNLSRVPEADTRKAVAYALDAQEILRMTNVDKGDVTEIPISPVRWYGPDNPSRFGFSTEKIAELLDLSEALSLEMTVNRDDALQQHVAEEIQAELASVGIELEMKLLDAATYRDALNAKNFEVALETVSIDSDVELSSILADYTSNHAGYHSEEALGLLTQIATAHDASQIHQNFSLIGVELAEDMPYYCLFFKREAVLTGRGIEGSLHPSEHNIFRGIEDLTFAKQ